MAKNSPKTMENKESVEKVVQLSHVYLQNEPEPIRVLLEEREGSTIFVRRLRSGETDSGETINFIPSEENVVLTQEITGIGISLTPDVGRRDDLLTWLRLVPDGREGSTVYGRTLCYGEVDNGESIQLRPGDTFALRPGALVLELEAIDEQVAVVFDDGYKSITNTLWTWLSVGVRSVTAEEAMRFLLAAGRRLDESHRMLRLVKSKMADLENTVDGIPQRNLIYEIIGTVEMAVVAMNRALNMTSQLETHFSISTPLPASIFGKLDAIVALRNAYEHIEDRALGLVRGRAHPDALSIFNFERFFKERVIVYGPYELNLETEAAELLVDARQYLKKVVSELT